MRLLTHSGGYVEWCERRVGTWHGWPGLMPQHYSWWWPCWNASTLQQWALLSLNIQGLTQSHATHHSLCQTCSPLSRQNACTVMWLMSYYFSQLHQPQTQVVMHVYDAKHHVILDNSNSSNYVENDILIIWNLIGCPNVNCFLNCAILYIFCGKILIKKYHNIMEYEYDMSMSMIHMNMSNNSALWEQRYSKTWHDVTCSWYSNSATVGSAQLNYFI